MRRGAFAGFREGRCRAVGVAFVVLMLASAVGAQNRNRRLIPEDAPRLPQEQQKLFHLPPGFRIELVASEPAIGKPINLNFDAKGRLFVTTSVEYPFAPPPDREPRDAIRMVTDTDGDGLPETVTTFADALNIPIGVTPIPATRMLTISIGLSAKKCPYSVSCRA